MLRETKKLNEINTKGNNAITLIALIITIIVMLILLAVTISILVKSNIIGIAEQAADKTKTAYEKESNLNEITINGKNYGSVEDYIAGKEIYEATDPKYFEFEYDETNKTATLKKIKDEYCPECTWNGDYSVYFGTAPLYIKDGDKKITDIIIPSTVKIGETEYIVNNIGNLAFSNGSSYESELTSIIIPDSVTIIGESAFLGCSSLISINIPNSVTSIENTAFMYCSGLTSINIPNSVTEIEWNTFGYCSSLTSITFSEGVTSIDAFAFQACSSLTDVYYTGSEEDWKKISIDSYNTALTAATIHYNYTGENTE